MTGPETCSAAGPSRRRAPRPRSATYLYKGGTLAPFIVDVYFVALDASHRNADVALQMFLINMQSLSLAGLVSLPAPEHGAGRTRPYTQSCGKDGEVIDQSGVGLLKCGTSNDNRSFFSGHTTSVATMAALTCLHHQHLPLYGGGFADLVPCLAMSAVAAGTGILRLVYDEHWASDVLVAWGVGALSGYVLPSVLHYGFGGGRPIGEIHTSAFDAIPIAQAYPGGGGVGLTGTFLSRPTTRGQAFAWTRGSQRDTRFESPERDQAMTGSSPPDVPPIITDEGYYRKPLLGCRARTRWSW